MRRYSFSLDIDLVVSVCLALLLLLFFIITQLTTTLTLGQWLAKEPCTINSIFKQKVKEAT